MYNRIMEILVLLMDKFGDRSWEVDQIDQLNNDLIERGYTEHEINTAFTWLYNRFGDDSGGKPLRKIESLEPGEMSHRVLHEAESRYITPAAFGYLLQLRHLRLIGLKEMESIIERSLLFAVQPVSLEEIKSIAHLVLFEDNGPWNGHLKLIVPSRRGETYH